MKPSRATLGLLVGALLTTTLIATTTTAHLPEARGVAEEAFVEETGADCVRARYSELNMAVIEAEIAKYSAGAGWIVPNRIYVGAIDRAVSDISANMVASDDDEWWLSAKRDGKPELIRLERHDVAGKVAYVVGYRLEVC